jgi:hypothetical protein
VTPHLVRYVIATVAQRQRTWYQPLVYGGACRRILSNRCSAWTGPTVYAGGMNRPGLTCFKPRMTSRQVHMGGDTLQRALDMAAALAVGEFHSARDDKIWRACQSPSRTP